MFLPHGEVDRTNNTLRLTDAKIRTITLQSMIERTLYFSFFLSGFLEYSNNLFEDTRPFRRLGAQVILEDAVPQSTAPGLHLLNFADAASTRYVPASLWTDGAVPDFFFPCLSRRLRYCGY